MERQEKKIITDIKKMAKTGQMVAYAHSLTISFNLYFLSQAAVRIMAKDLVRTRAQIRKFYMMRANIQAISLKLQVAFVTDCCVVSTSLP